MSSTLTVLTTSGRRAIAKAAPNTTLSEVLHSACKSLRLKPEQYTLKHNGKPIDLTLTFRLSGLPNHAHLELIQSSRSPAVIAVALQLPEDLTSTNNGASSSEATRGSTGDATEATSRRLTGKFPSSTTVWQVLRQFEEGEASAEGPLSASTSTPSARKAAYNFTQSGIPVFESKDGKDEGGAGVAAAGTGTGSGAGKLLYRMPVVNFMGRELAGVEELQKTLAQLGIASGSASLRLSFRQTEEPLYEAILRTAKYFDVEGKGVETGAPGAGGSSNGGDADEKVENTDNLEAANQDTEMVDEKDTNAAQITTNPSSTTEQITSRHSHQENSTAESQSQPQSQPQSPQSQQPTMKSPNDPPPSPFPNPNISIFAPPTSTTPQAASFAHDPQDYETTIESARLHQARLASSGRNKRLPSDKELEEQERVKVEKLSAVNEVVIRVRLPNQMQVQQVFGREATTGALYAFVRGLLERGSGSESESQRFYLKYADEQGRQVQLKEGQQQLIRDCSFRGRVLVNFVWDEKVPLDIRQGPILKREYQEQARSLEVRAPQGVREPNGVSENQNGDAVRPQIPEATTAQSKEQKMKKFLGKLVRK